MIRLNSSSRRWLFWFLRIAALVAVCIAVNGTVRHALAQLSQYQWELRPGWIALASALYVLGLLPIVWFWRRSLVALGYPTPLPAAMFGYFLGHAGKYVPGKAMSVILQVAAVRPWVPMRVALISVLLETLTMMSVGATLAFVLSLAVLRTDAYIWLIALGMAVACGLPTLPAVLNWFARVGVVQIPDDVAPPEAKDSADIEKQLGGVSFRLLSLGWLAGIVCWTLLGLSLWATMRAIGVDQWGPIADLPRLITAVAFAVVAGFLSMLPGGIIVRDAVLMQLLAPVCGEANAFVSAVMMRLIWLVSELVTCGILYIGVEVRGQRSGRKAFKKGR